MKQPKFEVDAAQIAKLEATHKRVRESMTPKQLSIAREVDAAFEVEKAEMETRFDKEGELLEYAKSLCGFPLDMSEIEGLRNKFKTIQNGTMFTFNARRGTVALYRTPFGTLDNRDNYLKTLEKTVMDVTNSSQFTALSSRDLIKLAFKRFFKRSK